MSGSRPQPFLEVRVEDIVGLPTLLGLCAGYELGQWRSAQFAKYLIRHLIEFVYPMEEWNAANSTTGVEMTARAAEAVYKTQKYENRGEIGELILFAVLRAHYDALPVISKFFFKSAVNDTVKGFDAVHFLVGEDGLELWLGEVKFYSDASVAIRDAIRELRDHLDAEYLRGEFTWIGNKMRAGGQHYEEIRRLLDEKISLDQVFPVVHIPLLITYESQTIGAHNIVDKAYKAALENELRHHFEAFKGRCAVQRVSVHLILVPLGSKRALQEAFDKRLRAAQDL